MFTIVKGSNKNPPYKKYSFFLWIALSTIIYKSHPKRFFFNSLLISVFTRAFVCRSITTNERTQKMASFERIGVVSARKFARRNRTIFTTTTRRNGKKINDAIVKRATTTALTATKFVATTRERRRRRRNLRWFKKPYQSCDGICAPETKEKG